MTTAFMGLLIAGIGFALYLMAYGVFGGLVRKKMLNDAWRHTYDTGRAAVRRGWTYIALGVLLFAIFVKALMRVW